MQRSGRLINSMGKIVFLAWVVAGCGNSASSSGSEPPAAGGAPGEPSDPARGRSGAGGASAAGAGGAGGGESAGAGGESAGAGGAASGGSGGASSAPDPDPEATPDAGSNQTSDASESDGGMDVGQETMTPMNVPGQPPPSYEGAIPLYYGPKVGPVVEMNCPEDPTEGWTLYHDSFNIQRPHNRPINTRFSIEGGIYNFWVFPPDAPHSPTAMGRNPRTEARYGHTADAANGRNFTTGQRLYDADIRIERNAVSSAFMQIHTTASGGGPIGIRMQSNGDIVNNGSLTVVRGNSVPGGLVDKWFNFKAAFNANTLEVKIYVNNCLKSTYRGPRGDGNFYFKNGVYFCKTSQNGCYTHFKNIRLYRK